MAASEIPGRLPNPARGALLYGLVYGLGRVAAHLWRQGHRSTLAALLGPFGALRPWWRTALGFVLGAAWALELTVPGWLLSPRAAERRSVAAVYRALAGHLRAIGTSGAVEARQDLTAALNAACGSGSFNRSRSAGSSASRT